ncbi:MAG: hypothetical protein ABIH21_01930 [Patescibacteria group bacterium]
MSLESSFNPIADLASKRSERDAEAQSEQAELQLWNAFLETLDATTALQTQNENPDALLAPRDIEQSKLTEHPKLLTKPVIEDMIYQEITGSLEREKQTLTPEQKRALGVYLQSTDIADAIVKPPSIVVSEPGVTPRVVELIDQVRDRRSGFARQSLGEDFASRVDHLHTDLKKGFAKGTQWKNDLQTQLDAIEVPDVYNPKKYLDSAEMVAQISYADEVNDTNPVPPSLGTKRSKKQRLQDIADVRKEFTDRDPSLTDQLPSDSLMGQTAEVARNYRRYKQEETLRIKEAFLRDKINSLLTKQSMRVIK